MQGTWLERIRGRLCSAWDVLIGRAYAAYQAPDFSDGIRMRAALLQMQERDRRHGSLPPAYRAIIDNALATALEAEKP